MVGETATAPPLREWRWTLISGCVTLLLAFVAFFLPDIEWAPSGGIVGWLLLIAGLFELAFGWKRGLDAVGDAAVGSGLVTALAGLLFVANPMAGHLPVANVVMVWLFVRGAWVLAMSLRARSQRLSPWLALTGAVDVLLGSALLSDLPIAVLVHILFGPTRDIVARFSLLLAASFLVTSISQIAIALAERGRSATGSAA
jgi:uncharacterized membrane protein HdeD (DUF308 family)